jgi:hypothetical protein
VIGPADPLAGLRDYHLPEPVPWWPPAPGWWLLLVLIPGLLLLTLLLRRRARRRRLPSALAQRELTALRERYRRDADVPAYVSGLSQLLRRFVLARFPADSPGGLCGADWLRFLADRDDGDGFRTGVGRRLADAPYRPGAEIDAAALAELVERWIRRNRGGGG